MKIMDFGILMTDLEYHFPPFHVEIWRFVLEQLSQSFLWDSLLTDAIIIITICRNCTMYWHKSIITMRNTGWIQQEDESEEANMSLSSTSPTTPSNCARYYIDMFFYHFSVEFYVPYFNMIVIWRSEKLNNNERHDSNKHVSKYFEYHHKISTWFFVNTSEMVSPFF